MILSLKEIYCNYDKHIVVIPITLQNPNEKGFFEIGVYQCKKKLM